MPKPLLYRAGSIVYFQRDPGDKVFILQKGSVDLAYQDIETRRDVHDRVQPGEFFGVKSALGRYPREENAVALQDSTIMTLTVPEFEAVAAANTRIIMKMLKVFSNQLRRVHRQVNSLMANAEQNPEEGLFNLGGYYLKNRRFEHARHVWSRYLAYYPSGKFATQAAKNLLTVEAAMGRSRTPAQQTAGPGAQDAGAVNIDMSTFGRFARAFKAGEMIFAEFEPGDTFYLIQSGRVELVKVIGNNEKTLDVLQPSEMFGEMAILENSPRSATAIALDIVKTLEFNSQNFEILMLGNPQIALKLLKLFCKRIYDSKRRFMILTLSDPQAKLADVFLMLDESQGGIDRSTERREFKTTVEDIARWAGMGVSETRDGLGHFVTQRRIEIFEDRIVVFNLNDFSRFVSARRKK